MNTLKTTPDFITSPLLILGLILASLVAVFTYAQPASAAELTTWQKFVQKECSSGSPDAAEACAARLKDDLKEECGKPKNNDTYIKCWRKFIRDRGGTAGSDSSPFETEKEPELEGTGTEGCGEIQTSLVDCKAAGGNPIIGIMLQVINFLAVGVGIAVVGGIIWGGLTYASSNGDASKVQQGKMIIVNAVVGLLLFFFMYALINYLVPGGLFN